MKLVAIFAFVALLAICQLAVAEPAGPFDAEFNPFGLLRGPKEKGPGKGPGHGKGPKPPKGPSSSSSSSSEESKPRPPPPRPGNLIKILVSN